jgi:cholesterol oxidase
MAMWPNKGEPDPRPSLESVYESVPSVSPNSPAVDPAILSLDPLS